MKRINTEEDEIQAREKGDNQAGAFDAPPTDF